MPLDLDQAAEILARGRLDRTPLDFLPETCRPETETQAYEIQSLLNARLETLGLGPRTGYKIGCTTSVMQEFLEIDHPCAGGIMAGTVHHQVGDTRFDDFQHVGVECEIAVRMSEDVVISPGRKTTSAEVARAVGSCMVAIEIVDDRYADYATTSTPTLIADNFFGASCVLGEEITSWRDLDLENIGGRMLVDETEVGAGQGSAILGHPLNALSWLASELAKTGQILKADEFVLLGSIVKTHWVNRGESIIAEIDGLGRIEARFS